MALEVGLGVRVGVSGGDKGISCDVVNIGMAERGRGEVWVKR